MYNVTTGAKRSHIQKIKDLVSLTSAGVLVAQTAFLSLAVLFVGQASAVTSYSDIPFTESEVASLQVDRSVPSGGYESTSFGGRDNVLEMSIDNENPNPLSGGFYDTEGLKKDITDSDAVKADVFVDSSWLSTDVRAGLWGVGRDASNNISNYPILEFTTTGESGHVGWRAWDGFNGGWTNLSNTYTTDGWNTLELKLNTQTNFFDYYINGELVKTYAGFGTQSVGEVIFNSFNYETTAADNYDVRWSNFAIGEEVADSQSSSTEAVYGDTYAVGAEPGWLFNRDQTTKTPFEFNRDESVTGNGSLYVLPIANTGNGNKDKFIGEFFSYTEIEEINSVSYDFKIGSGGDSSDANEFYLNVYANYGETTVGNYYDCKYDVVPATGSTTDWTSVTFDPTQSYPVTTRNSSPYICPAVPAEMNLQSINSRVRMMAINLGDTSASDLGLDGYFDNFVFNTRNEVTAYDFEPDVTGPSISEKDPDDDDIIGGTHKIRVKVTDVSGVRDDSVYARFKDESGDVKTYYLDREGSSDYFSKTVNTREFENRVKVYKRVSYRAVDLKGNARSSVADDVTVDNWGPAIGQKNPAENTTIGGTVNVRINVSDISGVKEDSVYVRFRANGGEFTFYLDREGSTDFYSRAIDTTAFVPEGTMSGPSRVSFRAIDGLGNPRSSVSDGVTIDNQAPAQVQGVSIVQDSIDLGCYPEVNNRTITVRWNAPADIDVVRYNYQADADLTAPFDFTTTATGTERTGTIRDQDGTYNYRVQAVDALGNVGEWSDWCGVTLDRVAPTTGFEDVTTTDTTPELLGTVVDGESVTVTINGVGYVANVTADSWQTNVTFPLATGSYDVEVTATDVAGNTVVDTYINGLTINPTPSPQVNGANTGDDDEEDSEDNNSSSSQSQSVGTPVAVAAVNTSTGIGGEGQGQVLADSTSENDSDENEEESSDNDGSQVLQSSDERTDEQEADDSDDDTEDDQCAKLFGVCWYWWIPVGLVVGYVLYRVSTRKD